MIASLHASEDCQSLNVTWESGETTCLPADLLRREAKDAWSIRERLDHGTVAVAPGIRITGVTQMGYGVNLAFSDGHDKAIYPFPYLRELSERA